MNCFIKQIYLGILPIAGILICLLFGHDLKLAFSLTIALPPPRRKAKERGRELVKASEVTVQ